MPRKNRLTSAERYGKTDPQMNRWLDGEGGATHAEIAKEIGVSPCRVGQLEAQGLRRIRRCFFLIELGIPVDDAVKYCRSTNGNSK